MSRNELWLRRLITDDDLAANVAARLDAKLDKTSDPNGCWLFTGKARSSFGYGLMYIGREHRKAGHGNSPTHRIAYVLANRDLPDGKWILHRCDNPPCCNPDHLFAGTHEENMADMMKKQRQQKQKGDEKDCAIYTGAQALAVVALARDGKSSTEIEKTLGVDKRFVSRVRIGVAWTSVTGLGRGELKSKRKLTEEDVIAIRQQYTDGARLDELGERFGVSASNISMVVTRRTWKKVA